MYVRLWWTMRTGYQLFLLSLHSPATRYRYVYLLPTLRGLLDRTLTVFNGERDVSSHGSSKERLILFAANRWNRIVNGKYARQLLHETGTIISVIAEAEIRLWLFILVGRGITVGAIVSAEPDFGEQNGARLQF